MHNYGIRTRNFVHTFRWHYHCTASINTSVLLFPLTGTIYISLSSLHSPLSTVCLRRKQCPVTLTRTAWVQFLPAPTHETCLCCSAKSGLMKLACLSSLLFRVAWRLVSDVLRGTRSAARAGHGVAGQGLNLEVLVLSSACQ